MFHSSYCRPEPFLRVHIFPENITNLSETIKPSLYTLTAIKQLLEVRDQGKVRFLHENEGQKAHQISLSHVTLAIKSAPPHFPNTLRPAPAFFSFLFKNWITVLNCILYTVVCYGRTPSYSVSQQLPITTLA